MKQARHTVPIFLCLLVIVGLLAPQFTHASTSNSSLDIGGWIPYWNDSKGITDAKKNIKSLDTVYPFAYSVKLDGTLKDLAGLDESNWKKFIKLAKSKKVAIIPTIMWSDAVSMHTILSDSLLRKNHINAITEMVQDGKYDGVDIDYEGKQSETKDSFSLFLKELKAKLGAKMLTCTVEARTPPDSLYRVVPAVMEYSNDYTQIAKYCDRVEIMGYDQQRADLKLNTARLGQPYMPVSDPEWVEKVIQLALKDIPKEKLVLGIPTYGHHYALTVTPLGYQGYQRIGALNPPDMLDVAHDYKVTPSRNSAGEMSFTYIPKNSTLKLPTSIKIPKDTPVGNTVSARAYAYAQKTGETVTVNMGWYSDAKAVSDKIALAKKYSLQGIALFKIDGEEDKGIWSLFK